MWHLLINCFLSTSTSSLMLPITRLWSPPVLTWLMTARNEGFKGLEEGFKGSLGFYCWHSVPPSRGEKFVMVV